MTTATETYEVSVTYGATPTTTVIVPAPDRTEFENFDELLGNLVKVPKTAPDTKD